VGVINSADSPLQGKPNTPFLLIMIFPLFRLLRDNIELTLYPPEEASEKMKEIMKQQEKTTGRLRSNR
jgi:hypothetical protein